MKAVLIAMVIILLPAALCAERTMGVFFTFQPNQMHYYPTMFEDFKAYIYAHNVNCELIHVEYRVVLPPGILLSDFELPDEAWGIIGDPLSGIKMHFNPALHGYSPGYNLLCTMTLHAEQWCLDYGGTLRDALVQVVAHPDWETIWGDCYPGMNSWDYVGLTSVLCPCEIRAETKAWGAIKALYR